MRAFTLFLVVCLIAQVTFAQKPVVITYAGGYNGNLVNTKKIVAKKLTHLMYAFADLKNNRAYLAYPKTDEINLRNLVKLKKISPELKILLSIGGLGWSHNFSDMASGVNALFRAIAQITQHIILFVVLHFNLNLNAH